MSSEPYNVDAEISSLRSTGLRSNTLTGIILKLLTTHFSRERGIQDPRLKSFIWNADLTESKILIVPVWHWQTPGSQQRPALVIKRNALQTRQLGLGDGQAIVPGLSSEKIPANQEVVSQIAVAGSHTIFAIAAVPTQAELLSTEVATRLIQYAQAIQNEFDFSKFRVAEIGALAKIEESSEHFVVPITVAYTYVDAWTVWSAAPLLKQLVVETNVKGR